MSHPYIDLHCDSLMMLLSADAARGTLNDSPYTSVDFKRMAQGGCMAQCFAIFLPPAELWQAPWFHHAPMTDEAYIAALHGELTQALALHSDVAALACSAADIRKNHAQGKLSAVLTMEDGRAVDGKLENLDRFHGLGVRALSLTWNAENCFGAPNSADPAVMARGLTPFGKEAVAYMQHIGILVDVSHLSDGGFWDVAGLCKKPFIATHSNARALSPHPRNLTDDMLRAIGDAGGVAGLNFGPEFLNSDPADRRSTAALIAKHARHMANAGGVGVVALGSDLDGIGGELEIGDCSKFPLLADAFQAEGFSEDEIDQIYSGNALRAMGDAIG